MVDLAAFLIECYRARVKGPLVVINTDNMPSNGSKIEGLMRDRAILEKAELETNEVEGEGRRERRRRRRRGREQAKSGPAKSGTRVVFYRISDIWCVGSPACVPRLLVVADVLDVDCQHHGRPHDVPPPQ